MLPVAPLADTDSSDQSDAAESCYDADVESCATNSGEKCSISSLSSTGTDVNYLHEALDRQDLVSEPSDSSVVAVLLEAIDAVNDHSDYHANKRSSPILCSFLCS